MEYLPGIKISAAAALRSAGIDTALVARRATESYLMQVLRHSFLHSDPHPGNVMVDTDGETPTHALPVTRCTDIPRACQSGCVPIGWCALLGMELLQVFMLLNA